VGRIVARGRWGKPSQRTSGIPSTYVPVRNLIFLAIAHAYAEAIDTDTVAIAVSQVDSSRYPDYRGAFLAAYQQAADLASRRFVEAGRRIPMLAPFLDVSMFPRRASSASAFVSVSTTD
jgi:7-cyano-7-deazaguanine synthase